MPSYNKTRLPRRLAKVAAIHAVTAAPEPVPDRNAPVVPTPGSSGFAHDYVPTMFTDFSAPHIPDTATGPWGRFVNDYSRNFHSFPLTSWIYNPEKLIGRRLAKPITNAANNWVEDSIKSKDELEKKEDALAEAGTPRTMWNSLDWWKDRRGYFLPPTAVANYAVDSGRELYKGNDAQSALALVNAGIEGSPIGLAASGLRLGGSLLSRGATKLFPKLMASGAAKAAPAVATQGSKTGVKELANLYRTGGTPATGGALTSTVAPMAANTSMYMVAPDAAETLDRRNHQIERNKQPITSGEQMRDAQQKGLMDENGVPTQKWKDIVKSQKGQPLPYSPGAALNQLKNISSFTPGDAYNYMKTSPNAKMLGGGLALGLLGSALL